MKYCELHRTWIFTIYNQISLHGKVLVFRITLQRRVSVQHYRKTSFHKI